MEPYDSWGKELSQLVAAAHFALGNYHLGMAVGDSEIIERGMNALEQALKPFDDEIDRAIEVFGEEQ